MPEFWRGSGFHLLRRNDDGHLSVTDDFLRAYYQRPELAPVAESCPAELALHASLLEAPSRAVSASELSQLADADAQENYEIILEFRNRLMAQGTIEAAYMDLFGGVPIRIPPIFIDQMVHVICRNMLEACEDAMRVRAAELLFRAQKATREEGAIMLADEETVEMHAASGGFGRIGRLLSESETPMRSIDLDILTEENKELYWAESDRYATVLDFTFTRPGLDAFCRVIEAWVGHFFRVGVSVQPVQSIRDERWAWHVGLDTESSAILNDLYNGEEVGEDRLSRLLSLFRLEFEDAAAMRADIAGRPVYLGVAMSADGAVRVKPQNLLTNLPLAETA